MTISIVVLAVMFITGALLALVFRWLVVCLCEGALLIAGLVLALFLHKSFLATFADLIECFIVMQTAYVLSGVFVEVCRHLRHLLDGRTIDKLN